MRMETRLALKQTQKLVMTAMLQQAIKLLPLSRLELVQHIRNELVENPLLIEETDLENGETDISEAEQQLEEDGKGPEIDWEPFIQANVDYGFNMDDYGEAPPIENTIKKETTLFDYLIWQLTISSRGEKQRQIGAIIIGNIDHNGYLTCPLADIAGEAKAEMVEVESVLKMIQSFDPTGVGARDLRECLLIQARSDGSSNALVEQIIVNYMNKLDPKLLPKSARELGITTEELVKTIEFIRKLDPFPGRKYSSDYPEYITPDVTIVKVNDEYQVILNEDDVPGLRINPYYQGILQSFKERTNNPTRHYIEERFRSALWLMKSIEQRRQTLYKVSASIVKFQREFLDKGLNYIRPLVLRDVAEDIEMHESTVSRVTANKYMHTPQGLVGMKYFFHSGLHSTFGDTMSSLKVKDLIKRLVLDENQNKPLTDQEIVEYLKRQRINIARRTVSKYRQELNISPSSKRKKFLPLAFDK